MDCVCVLVGGFFFGVLGVFWFVMFVLLFWCFGFGSVVMIEFFFRVVVDIDFYVMIFNVWCDFGVLVWLFEDWWFRR